VENDTPQEIPQDNNDTMHEVIVSQLESIRSDTRRNTTIELTGNFRNTLVKVLETEVSEHSMTKDTANRIFQEVGSELGYAWDKLFPTMYEVEVSYNWDVLFEVTLEADDDDDAIQQVRDQIEMNSASVNITCGISGWCGDVNDVDLGYHFDIADELTFTATEVE